MPAPDPRRLFLRYRKKGDAAALGRVFDLAAPQLLALAIHVTGDIATAEDAVQDTFLVAVESADGYEASRPFMPWLVGILINRARKGRDQRRDTRLRSADATGTPLDERASTAPLTDPARDVAAQEVQDLVQSAVDQLREPYRSVVDQHLSECAPPRDIAVALGRAPGTVRVQLHRGLEQLRELLSGGGATSARERLTGLGLALPAAAHFSRDVTVQLAAVREVVMQAAAGQAPATTYLIGSSTIPTSLIGAAAGACVLAIVAYQWSPGSDADTRLAEHDAVDVAALDSERPELTLAPVQDRTQSAQSPQEPHSAPRRSALEATPNAGGRRAATAAAPPRPPTEETTYDFYIEPMLDLRLVEEIDPYAVTGFRVIGVGSKTLASKRSPLIGMTQLKVGSSASPEELGPITFRIDHPGALPQNITIQPAGWFGLGRDYVARPSVVLREIKSTVRVLAKSVDGRVLDGRVQLRSFDNNGTVLHDETSLSVVDGVTSVTLRIPNPYREWAIFALSADERIAPQMLLFSGRGNVQITLDDRLLRQRQPTARFRFLDPFQQPVEGVLVRGHVIDGLIALRAGPESTPIVIQGYVFCMCDPGNPYAARLSGGYHMPRHRGLRNSILPALRNIEGHPLGEGIVVLLGAHQSLYNVTLQTSLNDQPVQGLIDSSIATFGGSGREPLDILAPIGALEIMAPKEILADKDGPKHWRRASVTVRAGWRSLGGHVDATLRARVLVPPDVPLVVEIVVPGFGPFEATHQGIAIGTVGVCLPTPVESDAEAGDNASDKAGGPPTDGASEAEGAGRTTDPDRAGAH